MHLIITLSCAFGLLLQEDTSLICIEKGDDQALAHEDKQSNRPIPTFVEEKENTSLTANQQAFVSGSVNMHT